MGGEGEGVCAGGGRWRMEGGGRRRWEEEIGRMQGEKKTMEETEGEERERDLGSRRRGLGRPLSGEGKGRA